MQTGMLYYAIDNSGAHKVKCVKVFRVKLPLPAVFLTVIVKTGIFSKKLQKGDVCKAIVVRLVQKTRRSFGYYVAYAMNAVVILKKNEIVPLGTRVRGTIFFELQKLGFTRIVSLSTTLV